VVSGGVVVSAKPDVSVLMSTLTVDAWLTEAVESVLDQGDVDLEVILVLDGAKAEDEPAWMRDRRVRMIALRHRSGLANALSIASGHARGRFLARMDADDVSVPGRLSKTQQYLESSADVAVVGTSAELIDPEGRVVGELSSSAGDDVRRALVVKNRLVHSSVVMRRSVYEQVGGYNPRLPQMEDYDLWLRMALLGRVAVLPDLLLRYRVHGSQMSRKAAPRGQYVSEISRGQYKLGRALGAPAIGVIPSVLTWRAAQFARYFGVVKSGYDRAAGRGS
jgi:glycosyltransferase involved in cell wall biosynthesis